MRRLLEHADWVLVPIALAAGFIVLRGRSYLVVDGALHCLLVYWHGRPAANGNNHLLYLTNVYAWTKALGILGMTPKDPFDFVRAVQWMNAIGAGASLALFYLIVSRACGNRAVALMATIAYGFSNAFLIYATSAAEPMIGLFWSLASVLAVASGVAAASRVRLFAGGVLLLLAMANYQSMVLIGPAETMLIYWQADADRRRLVSWFLMGCLFGALGIYVPVYAMSGTSSPAAMWARFFHGGGEWAIYGGFSFSRLVNALVGLANGMLSCLPLKYEGIRALIRRHDDWIIWSSIVVLAAVSWMAWTMIRLFSLWPNLDCQRKIIVACCFIGLMFDLFPVLFWGPLYEKLWLQPLAIIFLLWGVTFEAWLRRARPRMMLLPEGVIVAAILIFGTANVGQSAQTSTACMSAARELSGILQPSDLVVAGWDRVTPLYAGFLSDGSNEFDVPGSATSFGAETLSLLEQRVRKTEELSGRVYFVGILDLSEPEWDSYLSRCGLPYHSLDRLRACAKPIAMLSCSAHEHEVVRRLSFDCLSGPSKAKD